MWIRVLALVLSLACLGARAVPPSPQSAAASSTPRSKVLGASLRDFGLSASSFKGEVWGVLMETGLEGQQAFSLAVLVDGTADVYDSKGGGVFGAGKDVRVQRAAREMLLMADALKQEAHAATETPLPGLDMVTFYLLSERGILPYTAPQLKLRKGQDKLSRLFYAGQQVLSAIKAVKFK